MNVSNFAIKILKYIASKNKAGEKVSQYSAMRDLAPSNNEKDISEYVKNNANFFNAWHELENNRLIGDRLAGTGNSSISVYRVLKRGEKILNQA